MTSRDRSWSEKIRDLIEEVDRVRDESERVRGNADRAMKRSFWPERRRVPRDTSNETSHHHRRDDE
jgi:hypothetical protein